MSTRITLIRGDGIGVEISSAVLRILSAAGANIDWDVQLAGMEAVRSGGNPLPDATIASIRANRVALKGPLETPVGSGYRSVNVALRQEFELFANVRPARTLLPSGRFQNIDIVLIRENVEGLYSGVEHYIRIGDDPRAALRVAFTVFALALLPKVFLSVRVSQYGFGLALPGTLLALGALLHDVPAWIARRGGSGWFFRAVVLAALAAATENFCEIYDRLLSQRTVRVGEGRDVVLADHRAAPLRGMLEEIGTVDNIPKYVALAKDKSSNFRLMGFGHRVYKNFDPRAKIIRAMCHKVLAQMGRSDNPLFELALRLEEVALKDEYFVSRKLYPNVDFYSGIIYSALGIPRSMFTVMFAIARTVGWVAHWQEMISDPAMRIGRPRQLYTGAAKRATSAAKTAR